MSDWSRDARATAGSTESTLRNGADAVTSTARNAAKTAGDAAKTVGDAAGQALSRSSEAMRAGADQVSATAGMLSEQIRGQPLAAAAVCLGFGVLAGMLLARRR